MSWPLAEEQVVPTHRFSTHLQQEAPANRSYQRGDLNTNATTNLTPDPSYSPHEHSSFSEAQTSRRRLSQESLTKLPDSEASVNRESEKIHDRDDQLFDGPSNVHTEEILEAERVKALKRSRRRALPYCLEEYRITNPQQVRGFGLPGSEYYFQNRALEHPSKPPEQRPVQPGAENNAENTSRRSITQNQPPKQRLIPEPLEQPASQDCNAITPRESRQNVLELEQLEQPVAESHHLATYKNIGSSIQNTVDAEQPEESATYVTVEPIRCQSAQKVLDVEQLQQPETDPDAAKDNNYRRSLRRPLNNEQIRRSGSHKAVKKISHRRIPSSQKGLHAKKLRNKTPQNLQAGIPVIRFPHPSPSPFPPLLTDAEKMAIEKRKAAWRASLDRHPGTEYKYIPVPGHSAATVAKSNVTASASGNDISVPTTKRFRFKYFKISAPPKRRPSSRIQSAAGKKAKAVPHSITGPVLSNRQENVAPTKEKSLLRPSSPSHQPNTPRGRTLGLLASLKTTFSRSNPNFHAKSAINVAVSLPTVSVTIDTSPPIPAFTTNIKQIHSAQLSGYWCGRFQTILGHFQEEALQKAIANPLLLTRYVGNPYPGPQIVKNKFYFRRRRNANKVDEDEWNRVEAWEKKERKITDDTFEQERKERRLKALKYLETICVTEEAKLSFWKWQLYYARYDVRDEAYLPEGGCMFDDEPVNLAARECDITNTPFGSPSASVGQSEWNELRKEGSMSSLRQPNESQLAQRAPPSVPAISPACLQNDIYSHPAAPTRGPPPIPSTQTAPLQDATNNRSSLDCLNPSTIDTPIDPLQNVIKAQAAAPTRPPQPFSEVQAAPVENAVDRLTAATPLPSAPPKPIQHIDSAN